jgi:hypothetical protein
MAVTQITTNPDDDDAANKMAEVFGPLQIDQSIRHALQFCWMSLPKEKRTTEEWEQQLRRIFERAIKDFKDDRTQFSRLT